MTTHVYLKYAIALLMEEYGLRTEQEITFKEIKEELEKIGRASCRERV